MFERKISCARTQIEAVETDVLEPSANEELSQDLSDVNFATNVK
ncbi:hypothetical protein L798_07267 [Zootermopsis nevadensis]|uniref:Uncharacterized protein n=1 Tax=Zootermopsis nevadensis TaxID=136037 RepID=A0A067RCS2_ZOONE|nr:hypothetical protein L798_07267 [Zootermopsis nevadensis]